MAEKERKKVNLELRRDESACGGDVLRADFPTPKEEKQREREKKARSGRGKEEESEEERHPRTKLGKRSKEVERKCMLTSSSHNDELVLSQESSLK